MYLIPLTVHLRMVNTVNFMCCIFYPSKKVVVGGSRKGKPVQRTNRSGWNRKIFREEKGNEYLKEEFGVIGDKVLHRRLRNLFQV